MVHSVAQEGSAVPTAQYVRPVLADSRLWAIGAWLSAALDDPNVCEDMKVDIREWFEGNLHIRPAPPAEPDLSFGAFMETIYGKDEK